jgi:hypothetical protein
MCSDSSESHTSTQTRGGYDVVTTSMADARKRVVFADDADTWPCSDLASDSGGQRVGTPLKFYSKA